VYKNPVAALQRLSASVAGAGHMGLFAYNERPTFAVANDCWFRARRNTTRPFFFSPPVLIQPLEALR
jgi:hypothetical protein